jgi:hypothetical protein
VKYALYIVAAFVVGLGIGKNAQLAAPSETAVLQRCIADFSRTLELLNQALPPAPKQAAGPEPSPATPVIVPALDDEQEGEIV